MGGRSDRARAKTIAALVKPVAGARLAGNDGAVVTGLVYDSRLVRPGYAFICVPGATTDGHLYIPQAVEKGAAALVVQDGREPGSPPLPEGWMQTGALVSVPDTMAAMAPMALEFFDYPSSKLTLAGVTGTNGKTTTAQMLDAIFRTAGYESGLIGTIEYRIAGRTMKARHTTPFAVDLQAMLAECVEAGATHAAMEVSSHALSLHRTDGCTFAAAVFTNLTPEHLDFHADMQDYLAAKQRLFADSQYLPRDRERANAINADDEAGREIARVALGRTLTYGVATRADFRAEEIKLGPAGTSFIVTTAEGRLPVSMRLLGMFNVYNALGALTAAAGLGIPVEAAQQALREMDPVRGRLERVPSAARTVLVDYAHSPDGLTQALNAVRQLTAGEVIVVFGCGGNRDRTKRPVMGEIASRLADRCVVTSDNPRNEQPEAIIEEIASGIPADVRSRCTVEPDRATAIRKAIEAATANDLVLIAGKGHEDYQIFAGGRTIHFDDREAARAVLREIEGAGDG